MTLSQAAPPTSGPWPLELRLRRAARMLDVSFDTGERFSLTAEQLRRASPSAADRGHGPRSEAPLEMDAGNVAITDVRPVGRYAVRLVFDDQHDTGLYTWPLLYRLGREAVG